MAAILKRRYDLLDLKVCLDTSGPTLKVVCELEASRDGTTRRLDHWTFSRSDFGIPESSGPDPTPAATIPYRLPDGFGVQLNEHLGSEPDGPEIPLWLHLDESSGDLDLVPWEELLFPFVPMPILRLPEFVVEPPAETPRTLDVLLWTSMPQAKSAFDLPGYLEQAVRRIREAVSSRKITVHVFTDSDFRDGLRGLFRDNPVPDTTVEIYDPEAAAGFTVPTREESLRDPQGTLENPWFRWMHESLKNQSIDIVHYIGHGYFSRDWPALALSEGPARNRDREWARFVGPAQLNTFLNRVGAWAFACGSPPGNYSDPGLRHLAHTIARLRPGVVMYHMLGRPRGEDALGSAYRFLFEPGPNPPPRSPDLFLYCQPFQVGQAATRSAQTRGVILESFSAQGDPDEPTTTRSAGVAALESIALPQAEALEVFRQPENVPTWLAATQRYVEQWGWTIKQWESDSPDDRGRRREQIEGVRTALGTIQQMVARVLAESKETL